MRYVSAYLLAVLGGNADPSSADLQKILSSVGIDIDNDRLNKVISELKGKSIEELIAQGREKLSSMPSGGGAVAAAPAGGKLFHSTFMIYVWLMLNCYFRRCCTSRCCRREERSQEGRGV
jgi:large subunit ribosomal protein LP2